MTPPDTIASTVAVITIEKKFKNGDVYASYRETKDGNHVAYCDMLRASTATQTKSRLRPPCCRCQLQCQLPCLPIPTWISFLQVVRAQSRLPSLQSSFVLLRAALLDPPRNKPIILRKDQGRPHLLLYLLLCRPRPESVSLFHQNRARAKLYLVPSSDCASTKALNAFQPHLPRALRAPQVDRILFHHPHRTQSTEAADLVPLLFFLPLWTPTPLKCPGNGL